MKSLIKCIWIVAVVFWFVSGVKKDALPPPTALHPELLNDPVQTITHVQPFTVTKKNITYTITPVFDYELYGLVVTHHSSTHWFDIYHANWRDFINLKDICVLWGDNIRSGVYQALKFSSGDFTAYWKCKFGTTRETWQQFKNECISNNHLLADDPHVQQVIIRMHKGDQVHLKGHLVHYSHSNGAWQRGTSTTRTDTWGGSCETIYVTQAEILQTANGTWRMLHTLAGYVFIICTVILVIWFFTV